MKKVTRDKPGREAVERSVLALASMTASQLRARHLEVFGEPSRSGNKSYLAKRIGWRLQSLAEGGLSERARRRAEELARDADLRTTVPRPPKDAAGTTTTTVVQVIPRKKTSHDRLPTPGTVLTRTYRGRRVEVKVLTDGFEHDGQRYGSLSAVAKAITGSHWNGHLFFGLTSMARKGERHG